MVRVSKERKHTQREEGVWKRGHRESESSDRETRQSSKELDFGQPV